MLAAPLTAVSGIIQGMMDSGCRVACLLLLFLSGCTVPAAPEPPVLQEILQDRAQVFSAFQEYVKSGSYGDAHKCMTMAAQRSLPYEQFYTAMTAFEPLRRLIATSHTHEVDTAERLSLCNAEFGIHRTLGIGTLKARGKTFYQLDLTREDLDYLRQQLLDWYRHQVKRADGWHHAYPPDWTYATLSRPCGKK
jgi:hypothetical protein